MMQEILKQLLIEIVKWAAIGILTWLVAKLPVIRSAIHHTTLPKGTTSWVIAAIVFAGFLSSVASIIYTQSVYRSLGAWGNSPEQPGVVDIKGGYGPIEAVCPIGSYVVGVRNFGNRAPPYCIGCFVGVQVICRQVVK